jgi:hypothetical protein
MKIWHLPEKNSRKNYHYKEKTLKSRTPANRTSFAGV